MLGSTSITAVVWGDGNLDAVVFVDGNNLYHNVKAMGIRPGDIDFEKLVDFVCAELNCNRKAVYYYNSEPDISDGENRYYSAQRFFSELRRIGFVVKTRKLQKQSNEKEISKRLRVIDDESYCIQCRPLAEKMCTECIGRFSKKEKGIDVLMAIDMLALCALGNDYGMCILVSGDADFIPALDVMKKSGKEVASAFVYHGYSSNLRQKHRFRAIRDDELDKLLRSNHL